MMMMMMVIDPTAQTLPSARMQIGCVSVLAPGLRGCAKKENWKNFAILFTKDVLASVLGSLSLARVNFYVTE